jgi:hypothetical protein
VRESGLVVAEGGFGPMSMCGPSRYSGLRSDDVACSPDSEREGVQECVPA